LVACTSGRHVVSSNGDGSGTAGIGTGGGDSGATGVGTGGGGSGAVGGLAGGGTVGDSGRDAADGIPPIDEGNTADVPNDPSSETGSAACTGLLCEDFEQGQGQLDPSKWDLKMGAGGTEMIQQQIVAHGKYALHVHGTGAKGDFAMILTKSAPTALQGSGPIFGRAYLFTTPNNSPHVELGFVGTTGYPNLNYMEFAEFGGGSWQLGFDLFTPAPSVAKGFVEEASYSHPTVKMPVMTWSCIQWEFNDQPDMMVLWVDGKQIDQFDVQHIDYTSVPRTTGSVLNGMSSGIIGGFAVFGFGFHSWGGSNAFDVYYDDLVLDTKKVDCLPNSGPSGG
jgi:hypothetical protein